MGAINKRGPREGQLHSNITRSRDAIIVSFASAPAPAKLTFGGQIRPLTVRKVLEEGEEQEEESGQEVKKEEQGGTADGMEINGMGAQKPLPLLEQEVSLGFINLF